MVNKFKSVNFDSIRVCVTIKISQLIFLFLSIPLQGGTLEMVILSATISFSFKWNVILLLCHFKIQCALSENTRSN